MTLHVDRTQGTLHLYVTDDGHTTHTPHPHPVTPDAESGRGLTLINAFAHDWGWITAATSRIVYVTLLWPTPDACAAAARQARR